MPKLGLNQADIQQTNRALILRLLWERRSVTRAQLADLTHLQQATITNLVRDLIDLGFIMETGLTTGMRGRRSIALSLNPNAAHVLGIRLSRSDLQVGRFDFLGGVVATRSVQLQAGITPRQALAEIRALLPELLAHPSKAPVVGVGLGTPGAIIGEGRITHMTNFPGWSDILVKEELEAIAHCPVFLIHDANASAWAEHWAGKARGVRSVLYVIAGRGVGAGLILDGQLYRGSHDEPGEIGHTSIDWNGPRCECGNHGCLELYGSSLSLLARAQRTPWGACLTDPREVLDLASAGHAGALELVRETGRALGVGIVNLIKVLDPEMVIIGDELAQVGQPLLDAVRLAAIERMPPDAAGRVTITLGEVSPDPIMFGAALLVIRDVLERPALYQTCRRREGGRWATPDGDQPALA